MKWIKKLFILSVFLPIFLINGANASTRITNFRRTYVSTINFKTYAPNNTYTNQAIQNYVYSPIYKNYIIESGDTFRASSLELNLSSSIDVTTSDYWELSIYVITKVSGEIYIPTVLCPSFTSSGVMIDSCDTVFHDSISDIDFIASRGESNITYDFYDDNFSFVELKLKGHFTWGQTLSQLKLSGPFLAIKNYNSSDALSGEFLLGFNALRIYEEEVVEDKAAAELEEQNEKDEQDRNNIESQNSSTENSADSVQDDVESATSGISANISTIIGAFNTRATDCKLRVNTGPLDLGNINLCSAPSSIRTLINNIMSIVVTISVLMVSYSVIKAFLRLYEGFVGK